MYGDEPLPPLGIRARAPNLASQTSSRRVFLRSFRNPMRGLTQCAQEQIEREVKKGERGRARAARPTRSRRRSVRRARPHPGRVLPVLWPLFALLNRWDGPMICRLGIAHRSDQQSAPEFHRFDPSWPRRHRTLATITSMLHRSSIAWSLLSYGRFRACLRRAAHRQRVPPARYDPETSGLWQSCSPSRSRCLAELA